MKHRRVAPSTIQVPEVRVTASWDEEHLSMFKESIQTLGQLEPILCVEQGEQLILVDGLHRLQEAIARGDSRVDVVSIPGSLQDVLLQNLVTNRLRGKTKTSEMVAVIAALSEEFGMDSDAIREKTGLSRDYIERLQWVSQAIPEVRGALDDDQIGVGHAYEIARYLTPDEQFRMLQLLLQYRWKVADLREYVQLTIHSRHPEDLEAPPAAVRPLIHLASCHYCHTAMGPQHLVSMPTCPSCSGLLLQMVQETERLARGQGAQS